MATVISFNPEGHIYTRPDGVVVPGVTDLCGIYGDDVDEYVESAMDIAADRGVTMHTVLELALRGEDYDGEYPAIYAEYVESIEEWLDEKKPVPLAIETPVYSERLNIAGTPDLLCEIKDVLTLVDYKFVSSINKPKVRAQLLGYCEIFNDLGVFPEQMIAVQFMRDKPRPYPVDFGGDEWEAAKHVWQIKHRKYARGRIG